MVKSLEFLLMGSIALAGLNAGGFAQELPQEYRKVQDAHLKKQEPSQSYYAKHIKNNSKFSRKQKRIFKDLEDRMNDAIRPAENSFRQFKHFYITILGEKVRMNIAVENIKRGRASGALKISVYPDEKFWYKKIGLENVEIYLITKEKSRFEKKAFGVTLNRRHGTALNIPVEYAVAEDGELLFKKTGNLIFDVVQKLGIKKKTMKDLFSMHPGVFSKMLKDPETKQKILSMGNKIAKDRVYYKKISYYGSRAYDLTSFNEFKFYCSEIETGEEAIIGIGVYTQLHKYKGIGIQVGKVSNNEGLFFPYKWK